MELYEIVKIDIEQRGDNYYMGKTSVITSTTDKEMAECMLSIYKQNCNMDEAYNIRIVRAPEVKEF